MVDAYLPINQHPLSVLFVDFNSYFASVEQQERPELRGKPVIVVPMDVDTTCAIAASQEAKKLGIRCGTNVADAKQRCKDLVVVPVRPKLYKGYHEAIREVLQTVLPEQAVHSIDEMSYGLIGDERKPEQARKLALQMKEKLAHHIGPWVTCSIGVASNSFLAKMATELQKPNGLVVLEADALPGPFLDLKLTDFCGINRRMAARLNSSLIFTTKDLYAASPLKLREAFGSIVGERWWYLLRGYDLPETKTERKSLSHSHVLPPELRTEEKAKQVMLRLIHKAAMRLRSAELWSERMSVKVSGFKKSWEEEIRLPASQDATTFGNAFELAWKRRDFVGPRQVSVNFTHLQRACEVTPSLFDERQIGDVIKDQKRVSEAVDEINKKFGKHSIYLAGIAEAKDSAEERIAFNKTWLLSEGKGDDDWVNTFRGLTRDL